MPALLKTCAALFAAALVSACDTLDSDWNSGSYNYDTGNYTTYSGDNRSQQQRLDDSAYWQDYHRRTGS